MKTIPEVVKKMAIHPAYRAAVNSARRTRGPVAVTGAIECSSCLSVDDLGTSSNAGVAAGAYGAGVSFGTPNTAISVGYSNPGASAG